MRILVRRAAALGDVLSITPILTRLRQENPNAQIVVHTVYPNIFEHNYAINAINAEGEFDRIIDLDGVHENNRTIHAIDAYAEVAFDGAPWLRWHDKSIIFNNPTAKIEADKKFVSIHPNKSWQNRTMPNHWWDEVVAGMNSAGYPVAVLGTDIDYLPSGQVLDTRNQLDLKTQHAFIAASEVFICGASGLFILAAATSTPVVVPLTIGSVKRSLPWRWGVQGGGFYPVLATVPCFGCDALAAPGATFVGCESPLKPEGQPDYACVDTIKSEEVIQLALGAIQCIKGS